MPSDCYCKGCETTGHVDKVCLKQQRASANVSEEKKSEDKEKGEEKKEEKHNQTPPAGGRDFSRARGTAKINHNAIFGSGGCPSYICTIEL